LFLELIFYPNYPLFSGIVELSGEFNFEAEFYNFGIEQVLNADR
jgi:hypothetical protein